MKKIFTIFMAVAMIFALCTLSVSAASAAREEGDLNSNVWYSVVANVGPYAGFAGSIGRSDTGDIQIETFCASENANGEWVQNSKWSGIGSEVSNTVYTSGTDLISTCTEHHYYFNGAYVDTITLDVFLGSDI